MKKQFRTHLVVIILLLALLIGMIGLAGAKYVTTTSFNGKVTFSARLADAVIIQEHKAEQQSDGSYVLNETADPVTANTYHLIPGLPIPKDPHIVITGKTPIHAHLYLEVLDATPNGAIEYDLEDCWKITDLQPKKLTDAKVYQYVDSTKKPIVLTDKQMTENTLSVNIIKGKTITVKQGLLNYGNDSKSLQFSAYLEETVQSG